MQMRHYEIDRIKQAKQMYYASIGIGEVDNRSRKQSYARAAFAVAFRNYATFEELAKVLKRDHSTLVYAIKEHNFRLGYQDYIALYNQACAVRDATDLEPIMVYNISDLENEIKKLNEMVTELVKYKELYLTLKKTFDEF